MLVVVKLLASLRDTAVNTERGICRLSVPEGSTVRDVLQQLHIPGDMPVVVLANGVQSETSAGLRDDWPRT